MFLIANEETYEDGQIILEEGSYGDWIYVVQSGQVEISKTIDTRKVIIEILKEGEVFGELGLFAKLPRTATARAMGSTKVGIIDKNFLIEEFNKLSGDFRTILITIISRLNKANETAVRIKLRRDTPRIPKVLSLNYSKEKDLINAYTDNAGKGGLFIKTQKPLPKGERFSLKLQLPGESEPVRIECLVSWIRKPSEGTTNPPGMGVEFLQMEETVQERLVHVLTQKNTIH